MYGHWPGCSCETCFKVYDNHNQEIWCACQGCLTRRNSWGETQIIEKGNSNVATVNFCERCDSMGKSNVMGKIQYRTDPSQDLQQIEICPGCVGEFMSWLTDPLMGSRERAYREPWSPEDTAPESSGEIVTDTVIKQIAAAVKKELADE